MLNENRRLIISNLNVLIVDDVVTVRNVLTKSLKKIGVEKIQQASSILSAWEKLLGSPESDDFVNLILCDWNMPEGDGIDLLKKIRSSNNERIKHTPFVMVTGSNDKVLEAMDEGANNIVHKPFTPELIKAKLEIIYGPA